MRTWIAVIAIGFWGCSDDGGEPATQPDAATELVYPISFEVLGDVPLLVAVADDHGTWNPIPPVASNMYSAVTTNRHAIAVVCGAAPEFVTQVHLRTRFGDEPEFDCFNVPRTIARVAVTGQMMQPGEIQMDGRDSGTTSPWTYDIAVSRGTHDLFAFGESKVAVRRALPITDATTLPPIDVALDGVAYDLVSVPLDNASTDEMVETVSIAYTGTDVVEYRRAGTTLYSLSNALEPSDFLLDELRANTPTTLRSHPIEEIGDVVPRVTLMPRLEGIEFTGTGARWSELPVATTRVQYTQADAMNYTTIVASSDYIDSATEIAVALDIPGFDEAWRTTGTEKAFSAYDARRSETTVFESATASARLRAESTRRLRMDRARSARSVDAGAARARR